MSLGSLSLSGSRGRNYPDGFPGLPVGDQTCGHPGYCTFRCSVRGVRAEGLAEAAIECGAGRIRG